MVEARLQEIRDAVRDIPEIAALLVFGSRARGTARPDSDLDVAFLPVAGYRPDHRRHRGDQGHVRERLVSRP